MHYRQNDITLNSFGRVDAVLDTATVDEYTNAQLTILHFQIFQLYL